MEITSDMSSSRIRIHSEPWPVQQTDTTAASGNALQACVAALLHLELTAVPNFIQHSMGYERALSEYMQTLGYTARKVVINPGGTANGDKDVGKLCVLRGQSPRGTFGHVVVAKCRVDHRFDILWDPHPDGTGLDTNVAFGWYMVFDPCRPL